MNVQAGGGSVSKLIINERRPGIDFGQYHDGEWLHNLDVVAIERNTR